jgi:hypothetical protein
MFPSSCLLSAATETHGCGGDVCHAVQNVYPFAAASPMINQKQTLT